jgi:hypothetical protein
LWHTTLLLRGVPYGQVVKSLPGPASGIPWDDDQPKTPANDVACEQTPLAVGSPPELGGIGMERIIGLLETAKEHPFWAVAALIGFGILLYLMNRKPRLVREAEEQLAVLRRDKAGTYDDLRRPK